MAQIRDADKGVGYESLNLGLGLKWSYHCQRLEQPRTALILFSLVMVIKRLSGIDRKCCAPPMLLPFPRDCRGRRVGVKVNSGGSLPSWDPQLWKDPTIFRLTRQSGCRI